MLARGDYGKNRKEWIASTIVGGHTYAVRVSCVSARSAMVQGSGELEKILKEHKIKAPDDWSVRIVGEGTEAYKEFDIWMSGGY